MEKLVIKHGEVNYGLKVRADMKGSGDTQTKLGLMEEKSSDSCQKMAIETWSPAVRMLDVLTNNPKTRMSVNSFYEHLLKI